MDIKRYSMKNLLPLFLMFCLTANIYGQKKEKLYILNAVELDTSRYKDHQGSAYFFDDYSTVDIMSVGGLLIEDIQANYNGLDGEWEIYHQDMYTLLPKNLYTDIYVYLEEGHRLYGDYPSEFRFSSNTHPKLMNKYVIVLYEDENVNLYEQFYIYENEKKVETPGKTVLTKKLFRRSIYNLVVGQEIYDVKRTKKSIIKTLGSKKEIEGILKSTDNKLKTSSDFIKLIKDLNEVGFFQ